MRWFERLFPPASYCADCGRPWFSTKRRPCDRCGATARVVMPIVRDSMQSKETARARKQ